jgi:hypothetical protein
MDTSIKKRVEYKADVIWYDVDLVDAFEGKYTARVIQPENLSEPFVDVYYNINGKVHSAVTNPEINIAVREEIQKGINNIP